VVIVHGYTGHPDKNWFPWLQAKLEALRIEVVVPQMPNPDAPQLSDWLGHLQKVVGKPDQKLWLVGHSLGCPTILRYLESLAPSEHVGGVILVAGFAEPILYPELDNFTRPAWNDAAIKAAAGHIILFNSDNDPYVPLVMGEHLKERFGAELHVVHEAGHFNWRNGYRELPAVLDTLSTFLEE